MASSLYSNAQHVDFDSVLGMDDPGMVSMFEALMASGLRGFLGCPAVVYEDALVDFFENASVRNGVVFSTVGGQIVEISEKIFVESFELPVDGLGDLSEMPKDAIFNARSIVSLSGEQINLYGRKNQMKMPYRLLCDIVAKAISVKAGSFNAITVEKFSLMTAVVCGVKMNWARFLFGVLKKMVAAKSKQAKGFAIQISLLLATFPTVELGEASEFPASKILSNKTVLRFVSINERDGAEEVKAAAKKKAASKKRTAADIEAAVPKKKRSLKKKSISSLELVEAQKSRNFKIDQIGPDIEYRPENFTGCPGQARTKPRRYQPSQCRRRRRRAAAAATMLRAAQGRALGRDKRGSASPMAAHGSAPPTSVLRNQCAKGQQPVGQRAQPAASNDRPTRNNFRGHRALLRAKQRPAMAQQLRNTTGHRAPSVVYPTAQQLSSSSAQPPGRDARQARITCAYVRGEGWLPSPMAAAGGHQEKLIFVQSIQSEIQEIRYNYGTIVLKDPSHSSDTIVGDRGGSGSRSRTPQNPPQVLNTLSLVSVWESRIQYLCDPQWFRDIASRGPTTIVAPESQFRTCPSDHDSIGYPRMSASSESSTTMHRLLHASGSHPIPPPNDPKSLLNAIVDHYTTQ
ncbi:dystroglycan-like [Dorcoceras hygrometricum]|uniref:Dystroglycan-like n=1 Tax=Dorcoceras hygrometricum TaxID=472368 RepID=A0A2Z7AG79_9LAMI|nr:dystroglycan-like [Dorcoceras hygrometricum]